MRYRRDVFDDKYARLRGDRPSKTIVAHLAKDGNGYVHPRQNRSISIREAARVQSFRDDYAFCGAASDQWTQLGNAVPPLLAEKDRQKFSSGAQEGIARCESNGPLRCCRFSASRAAAEAHWLRTHQRRCPGSHRAGEERSRRRCHRASRCTSDRSARRTARLSSATMAQEWTWTLSWDNGCSPPLTPKLGPARASLQAVGACLAKRELDDSLPTNSGSRLELIPQKKDMPYVDDYVVDYLASWPATLTSSTSPTACSSPASSTSSTGVPQGPGASRTRPTTSAPCRCWPATWWAGTAGRL